MRTTFGAGRGLPGCSAHSIRRSHTFTPLSIVTEGPVSSETKSGRGFDRDLAIRLPQTAVVEIPALIEDEEEVVARPPGPTQPAIQPHLVRDIVVLNERVPAQIGCERNV